MTMAPSSVFLPTLPGRYYTDPAIFEREKREIFEKQWLLVCRAEEVPAPGRFVRATAGNEVPRLRRRRGPGADRTGGHRPLVLPVVPRINGVGRNAVTAFDTRAVHAGHDPAQHNGSVTTAPREQALAG